MESSQLYAINDLNGDDIIGTLYEKELQKTNQQEFRIEKLTKKKVDKLYVKLKGYDSSFNIWTDKKDLSRATPLSAAPLNKCNFII